jgi:hypothetical protein
MSSIPIPQDVILNWSDVAPPDIATRQRAWERRQVVLRMMHLDFTYIEIGRYLGIGVSRVNLLASRAKGRDLKTRCPILVWSDVRNAVRDLIRSSE